MTVEELTEMSRTLKMSLNIDNCRKNVIKYVNVLNVMIMIKVMQERHAS